MAETLGTDDYEFVGDSYMPDKLAAALRRIEHPSELELDTALVQEHVEASHKGRVILGATAIGGVLAVAGFKTGKRVFQRAA